MTEDSAGVGGGRFSSKMALTSMVGGRPPLFAGSVADEGDFTEPPPLRLDLVSFIGNSLVMELSFTEGYAKNAIGACASVKGVALMMRGTGVVKVATELPPRLPPLQFTGIVP